MDRESGLVLLAIIGFIVLMVALLAFVHNIPGTGEGSDGTDLLTPGPTRTASPGAIQTRTPDQPVTTDSPPLVSPVTTLTPGGPASFQISVSPVNTQAHAGDRVPYTMVIVPEYGFSQPVSLSIEVSALMVFRQTYDLGIVSPPFPTTLTYEFTVPGNVPAGVTINGLLRATGGGIERQRTLSLQVT